MAGDEKTIRAHLEEIERKLAELKEKEAILLSLKEHYERWLAIERNSEHPHSKRVSRTQEGNLSLISAALKVLQEAYPEGLHVNEIWERLQALGVKSQAKRPAAALAFSLHSLGKTAPLR